MCHCKMIEMDDGAKNNLSLAIKTDMCFWCSLSSSLIAWYIHGHSLHLLSRQHDILSRFFLYNILEPLTYSKFYNYYFITTKWYIEYPYTNSTTSKDASCSMCWRQKLCM
jgi:hypothetical protein